MYRKLRFGRIGDAAHQQAHEMKCVRSPMARNRRLRRSGVAGRDAAPSAQDHSPSTVLAVSSASVIAMEGHCRFSCRPCRCTSALGVGTQARASMRSFHIGRTLQFILRDDRFQRQTDFVCSVNARVKLRQQVGVASSLPFQRFSHMIAEQSGIDATPTAWPHEFVDGSRCRRSIALSAFRRILSTIVEPRTQGQRA